MSKQRVKVWNGDQSEYLGEGTLEGEVEIYGIITSSGLTSLADPTQEPHPSQIPANGKLHRGKSPKILLDDGRVVFGCQTWWQAIGPDTPPEYSYDEPDLARLLKLGKASAQKFASN
tara:strand:+ start:537 stop:887 length:351 start_codon:yes stop_codon:yes gene_type:complete